MHAYTHTHARAHTHAYTDPPRSLQSGSVTVLQSSHSPQRRDGRSSSRLYVERRNQIHPEAAFAEQRYPPAAKAMGLLAHTCSKGSFSAPPCRRRRGSVGAHTVHVVRLADGPTLGRRLASSQQGTYR
eukprot:GHVU01172264.1.p2 GENE.GHVU01172264.1~~GHVU01172264.1.p2  ORF type:complete len:128 (+),score=7.29 GHVU01172264.1:380-763(+)